MKLEVVAHVTVSTDPPVGEEDVMEIVGNAFEELDISPSRWVDCNPNYHIGPVVVATMTVLEAD